MNPKLGFTGRARQGAGVFAPRLVAAELSVACGLTPATAEAMVTAAEALFLQDRLPGLARLLQAGWGGWPQGRLFVWETAHPDPAGARGGGAGGLGPGPGGAPLPGRPGVP